MKKTILFALIWVAAIACNNDKDAQPQVQGIETTVAYRVQTPVQASGQDLKVDLREVNDSRCPKNVVCIQAGSANVKFSISNGTAQTDVSVVFKNDEKGTGLQTFTLDGQSYSIRVSQVLPYPDTTQSPKLEDYKVNVTIEKK